MAYLASSQFDKAEKELSKSIEMTPTPWAYYGLAILKYINKDSDYSYLALRASKMLPSDASLAIEALRLVINAGLYKEALEQIENLSEDIKTNGRIKLYQFVSFVKCGMIKEAEELLNSSLVVADLQEGDNIITDVWYELEEIKAKRDGRFFDRESINPPQNIDFRMQATKKGS